MKIYGTPGASADAIERRRKAWRHAAGIAMVTGAVTLLFVGRPMVTVVVLVAGYLVRYRLQGMTIAARAGATGEQLVAERLRSYRPDVLIFDLDLRGEHTDIDVVVLGPAVATIEVKAARGRIRAMTDGTIRVGGRPLHGRPVAQAARHASSLRRFTDHHVEAVLCITQMRGRPQYVEYRQTEVLVTNARHLRRVLRRLPRLVSARQAHRLARLLRSGNNPSHQGTPSVH